VATVTLTVGSTSSQLANDVKAFKDNVIASRTKYPKLGCERIFARAGRLERLLFLSILLVVTRITGVITPVGRVPLGAIKHHTEEILFQKF
jgi:hypothetical protein